MVMTIQHNYTILSLLFFSFFAHTQNPPHLSQDDDWYQIDPDDCLTLPEDLSFNNFELLHVPSVEQGGPSCAWHALLNAKAVQEIVKEKKPLTGESVKKMVEDELIDDVFICANELEGQLGVDEVFGGLFLHQIAKLARALKVANYFDLYRRIDSDGFLVSSDKPCEEFGPHKMPGEEYTEIPKYMVFERKPVLSAIRKNKEPLNHVVFTIPSQDEIFHTVLLTIVRRKGAKPTVLLFNSSGASLDNTQEMSEFARAENNYIIELLKELDAA